MKTHKYVVISDRVPVCGTRAEIVWHADGPATWRPLLFFCSRPTSVYRSYFVERHLFVRGGSGPFRASPTGPFLLLFPSLVRASLSPVLPTHKSLPSCAYVFLFPRLCSSNLYLFKCGCAFSFLLRFAGPPPVPDLPPPAGLPPAPFIPHSASSTQRHTHHDEVTKSRPDRLAHRQRGAPRCPYLGVHGSGRCWGCRGGEECGRERGS